MMPFDDQRMQMAIATAEGARGFTGNNPWVGCVIVGEGGSVLGLGRTQGPGEDHAEIAAAREAEAHRHSIVGATLYSTLEPCAFHGRTPACAKSIAARGIRRVVIGMRDPHPRVDGEGIRILRDSGIEVVEGVCIDDVRRQLGVWVFTHHIHEPMARAKEMLTSLAREAMIDRIASMYAVPRALVESVTSHIEGPQKDI